MLHLRATLKAHEPPFVNDIDDGAVLAIGNTDARAFHKNTTFGVLLDLLAVPPSLSSKTRTASTAIRKLCMRAFRFMRYRRLMVAWLVLDRGLP